MELVNQYSDPNIGTALGLQGEALILEGFARIEFVMKGRDANRESSVNSYCRRETTLVASDTSK